MPLFFCALKGTWKQRQRRCTGKGGYSLSRKRIAPFKSPKRTRGESPSTPDIGSLDLEELHTLRNQVQCTWLRHESSANRYRLQPRLTIVRRE